jgi:glycerophosphoryl diester phosphodiesterase family protein
LSDNQLAAFPTRTEDLVVQTLRPLTIGELLDRTFFYYRRHFVLFVGIAALPSALLLVVQLAMVFVKPMRGSLVTTVLSLLMVFVYLVTTTLAHGATVVAVSQILLERETNVAEAFNSIRPRIGELIIISINVGVRVLLGALLLIVPGVLLALRYSLAIPVAVLEETGVSDSLSRSATLTKGHRGRILLVYFLLFVLIIIGTMLWPLLTMFVAGLLSSSVGAGASPVWMQVVLQFGSFVTESLLSPIMTIALTLVYYDERVRKEAFDLEHMMRQLDAAVLQPPHTA